jgi:putative ABC transport system permease protein
MAGSPPRFAEWLLTQLLLRHHHTPVLGDFEEIYQGKFESQEKLRADLWYWGQILKSFPAFLLGSLQWSLAMFKSYCRITLRSIRRHKVFSFINIAGLALGLACTLLIALWVLDELSYDRFHSHADRLFRIEADEDYSGRKRHNFISPPPLAPVLQAEVPEVELAARFTRFGGMQLTCQDKSFFEPDIRATDPAFFQMFSFTLIKGEASSVMNQPNSLVISQRMAQKYFGDSDPLGQVIQAEESFELEITGIVQDPPANSTLQYDWIVPFVFVEQNLNRMPEGWSDAISTFVLLREGIEANTVSPKLTELIRRNRSRESDNVYMLNPLKRLRLYATIGYGQLIGTIRHVYVFTLIALIVLFIACINFMNLSTARSSGRAREIGMRKVVGARRGNLIRQFYGESLLYTLFSLVLALGIVAAFLPVFNTVTQKALSLTVLVSGPVLVSGAALTLFTALIAGSYPALRLSSFKPVNTLYNLGGRANRSFFRKALVVVQFSLSILLIIATGVVIAQTRFMKNKDLGYEGEYLVLIPLRGEVAESYAALKQQLLQNSLIQSVSAMSRRPSMIGDYARDADWEGKDPAQDVRVIFSAVDFDLPETLELELVEGRSFAQEYSTDSQEAFLVNQETAKLLEKDSVVGTSFSMLGRTGKIIGVLKNFHFQPLRRDIQPLVFILAPNPHWLGNIVIRISPDNVGLAIAAISNTWQAVLPSYPFEYRFVNEDFELFYQQEQRMGQLLGYFAFLAVFIASLGLFGLSAFIVERRTKEIGIRKVLGASAASITLSFYREFVRLVGLAMFFAWPLAYFLARGWLNDFAFRISLGPWIFLLTGLLALFLALLTVGYQTLRAARANPAQTLQYE